jgi:uncharacterized membrane protein
MRRHHTVARFVVMVIVGVIAALLTAALGWWQYAPTVGWAVAALIYSTWVWIVIWRLDPEQTKEHASREEPARGVTDALIVVLSLASLFAVGFVLVSAGSASGAQRIILACLALVSVALSWLMLHTLFTLRYARQYYSGNGGIDFNQTDPPQYTEFAYLSFTIGMTFQVSDTNITSHAVRRTALRHGLISFVFGAVILASTINLIAGLSH